MDDKLGASGETTPSTNPQLSEAEVEAVVAKVFDKRIPGLMSSFQKQVNDAVAASRDTVNKSEKSITEMTPQEREVRVKEDALATREMAATRREVALEYGLKVEEVTGENKTEMELAAAKKLLAVKGVTIERITTLKPNSPAPTGNPPSSGSTMTPVEKIKAGLDAKER